MKPTTAALRAFRKPVLALVAAAGLGVWGGGAAGLRAPSPGATPVPGRAGIAAFQHVESAAHASGTATTALQTLGGERERTRLTGDGDPRIGGAAAPAPGLPGFSAAVPTLLVPFFPAPAAGLEAVSPRGPPSFPS
jgi:hypothetical protein